MYLIPKWWRQRETVLKLQERKKVCFFRLSQVSIKVTVDLQGCLPKNHSYARSLYYNHRKLYIVVKLLKCRIRRNIFFKIWFNGKRAQAFKCKTDTICWTELPAFVIASTTKQTVQCQSVADRLQKGVRLFRYSDWLTRKFILKLANWIFANLRHIRALKRKSILNIKKASHPFPHW